MRAATSWRKPLLEISKFSPRRTFISSTKRTSSPPLCIASKQIFLPTSSIPRPRFRSTSSSTESPNPSPAPRAPPKNHYEFFPLTLPHGPPPAGPFYIDPRALRKEFLQLQAIAHPDRHPANLKARAEGTSAAINAAYKTLQSPLLRAQYCLSLQGINVAEDETAKTQDTELLMQVMEIREEIEDAEEERELDVLKKENEKRVLESEDKIGKLFGEGNVEGVKAEAVRLRYWINVKESLDGWEKGREVVLNH